MDKENAIILAIIMIGISTFIFFSFLEKEKIKSKISNEERNKQITKDFHQVCYENVIYINDNKKLSVYIEPKTLEPVNCKGE